jgi:two-component system, OmpR family, response regulator
MAIRKILLVDDDQDLRRIAQLSLQNVGKWDVVLASCGPDALQLAQREQPDLILLDVMMPEMDGPETLSRLRADRATATIPVIFLTAKIQVHEVDHYMKFGVAGVIIKPFDPMTLPEEITRMLNGKND